MVAVVGEFGFGRVVAIGEYLLNEEKNMAEIAFSVSKDFQKKGLGKILQKKLSEAAHENGISGLYAYTSPQNEGMIRLFNTLHYKIETSFEEEMMILSCRFDELK
jgi:RimJ/RimL family protein N-acetyltransferase